MKQPKVVIIDDNPDILKLLKNNFEKEKFRAVIFRSGEEALLYLRRETTDLVICDWMLEDMEGLDVCRFLRKNPSFEKVAFIMLSARNLEIDVVTALEVGADDYILKPIRIREVLVRSKKLIERKRNREDRHIALSPRSEDLSVLTYNEIVVDKDKYVVQYAGREVGITLTEFKLLELFISNTGKVQSRSRIMDQIYGTDYNATERSVDVLVVSLRKKIPPLKKQIESIRGVGYKLRME